MKILCGVLSVLSVLLTAGRECGCASELPGAGGNIATGRVAKAAPDGHTLGMIGNGSLVFSPSMYDKLGFDPLKDFAPISQVFVAANVLVVPHDVPAKSLPELVALARLAAVIEREIPQWARVIRQAGIKARD